jgi:hypothetical protein
VASWSNTSFTSTLLKNFPPGPALVTVFTNSIPSVAKYLVVAQPIFAITVIAPVGNGNILLQRFSTPYNSNTIQVSPDLSPGGFATIATVMSDLTGAFQYQDTNALSRSGGAGLLSRDNNQAALTPDRDGRSKTLLEYDFPDLIV